MIKHVIVVTNPIDQLVYPVLVQHRVSASLAIALAEDCIVKIAHGSRSDSTHLVGSTIQFNTNHVSNGWEALPVGSKVVLEQA